MSFLKLTTIVSRSSSSLVNATTLQMLHNLAENCHPPASSFFTNSIEHNRHIRLMFDLKSHLSLAKQEIENKKAMRALEHYKIVNKLFDKIKPHALVNSEKEAIAFAFAQAADIIYHTSSKDHVALRYLDKALHLQPNFDKANKLREAILLERNEFPKSEF